MAARGILANPALFAGYQKTPVECVVDWLDLSIAMGFPVFNVHQHLMFILYDTHSKIGL